MQFRFGVIQSEAVAFFFFFSSSRGADLPDTILRLGILRAHTPRHTSKPHCPLLHPHYGVTVPAHVPGPQSRATLLKAPHDEKI